MKNVFTIVALIVAQSLVFGQDHYEEFDGEVKWSDFFEVSKRTAAPTVIGVDNRSIYLTRKIKSDLYIEKYTMSTLRMEKSVRLDLSYNGKGMTLVGQFMFNDQPVLYTSFYNKKTKTNYKFLQVVNTSTLEASKPELIGQSKKPKTKGIAMNIGMSLASEAGTLGGDFMISEDKQLGFSNEIVYADQEKKGEGLKVRELKGRLFDENLAMVAESGYNLPYDMFTIVEKRLGNDGLIYFAGYQTEEVTSSGGIRKNTSLVYGDLEILVMELETGNISSLIVDSEGRDVRSFTFRVEENGSIIISGLTGAENGGVSGGFYARYGANLQEETVSFYDFEEEFITQGWSEKSKKKLKKKQDKEDKKGEQKTEPSFYEYSLRDLIVKPDGSTTLLAEQYYVNVVTTTYTTSNGGTRTSTKYYYYYNDIIALTFDKEGELIWKTVVDKYQVSVNDDGYYSSFFTVLTGNDINIIYNDRESNTVDTEGMTRSELKALKRNTVGVRVLLNDEGGQSREKMFEFEEGGLRLVPKVCSYVNEDMAFLYARSTKGGDKIGSVQW